MISLIDQLIVEVHVDERVYFSDNYVVPSNIPNVKSFASRKQSEACSQQDIVSNLDFPLCNRLSSGLQLERLVVAVLTILVRKNLLRRKPQPRRESVELAVVKPQALHYISWVKEFSGKTGRVVLYE